MRVGEVVDMKLGRMWIWVGRMGIWGWGGWGYGVWEMGINKYKYKYK